MQKIFYYIVAFSPAQRRRAVVGLSLSDANWLRGLLEQDAPAPGASLPVPASQNPLIHRRIFATGIPEDSSYVLYRCRLWSPRLRRESSAPGRDGSI